MDYLFFSTLQFSPVLKLVVSYDVVCQWHKNLWHRMKIIPHTWHVDHEGRTSVVFLIPKFHLLAHIEYCHNNFSFNLTMGVGRTDGEGVERGWDHINPLATSTREMGPGSRRDTLDDHFGDRNWKKTTGLGTLAFKTWKKLTDLKYRRQSLTQNQDGGDQPLQTCRCLGRPDQGYP